MKEVLRTMSLLLIEMTTAVRMILILHCYLANTYCLLVGIVVVAAVVVAGGILIVENALVVLQ